MGESVYFIGEMCFYKLPPYRWMPTSLLSGIADAPYSTWDFFSMGGTYIQYSF
jgi:hypothetical protein